MRCFKCSIYQWKVAINIGGSVEAYMCRSRGRWVEDSKKIPRRLEYGEVWREHWKMKTKENSSIILLDIENLLLGTFDPVSCSVFFRPKIPLDSSFQSLVFYSSTCQGYAPFPVLTLWPVTESHQGKQGKTWMPKSVNHLGGPIIQN